MVQLQNLKQSCAIMKSQPRFSYFMPSPPPPQNHKIEGSKTTSPFQGVTNKELLPITTHLHL
jgi:hypothetical protein